MSRHPTPTREHAKRRIRLPRASSLGLRVRVLVRGTELDDRLARGASPHATEELALHARRITEPGQRRRIALTFERLLDAAEHPPTVSRNASAPLRRTEILKRRDVIMRLVTDLRELESPGARGVALARRLLTNGAGPLYNARGGDLAAELRRIVFMLESDPLGT